MIVHKSSYPWTQVCDACIRLPPWNGACKTIGVFAPPEQCPLCGAPKPQHPATTSEVVAAIGLPHFERWRDAGFTMHEIIVTGPRVDGDAATPYGVAILSARGFWYFATWSPFGWAHHRRITWLSAREAMLDHIESEERERLE